MTFSLLSMILAMCAPALPASFSILEDRNSNSTAPKINFTIKDHKGLDVTSSFKIMVYEEAQSQGKNNLNDRQVELVRSINTCNDREGIFMSSSCNRKDQDQGSLQAYTYHCLSYVRDPLGSRYTRRVILPFPGQCEDDEICVNGRGKNELGNRPTDVAYCVKSTAYKEINELTDSDQRDKAWKDLSVDATISGQDQKTPLKADSIDLEAGVSTLGGAKGTTQSKSCIDCVDLTIDKFAPKTDFLETEVKLMTTGVAAAGMLWLTILSG